MSDTVCVVRMGVLFGVASGSWDCEIYFIRMEREV